MLNETLLGWPTRLPLSCSLLSVSVANISRSARQWLRIWLSLASFIVVFLFCSPSFAADKITFLPSSEVAQHQATIDRLAIYISGLSTIVSNFTQVAPDGSLTTGKFFLRRPGKMRWQYNPPTPVLMIANGSEFVYYDYDLQQVSYVPLDSALIAFLAQEKIRFDEKVGIISFEEKDSAIRIGLAQRDKPDEGQLLLEFSDKPLLIRNMVVTDANKQVTTVALSNAKFGIKLDKSLFVFMDPRKGGRGKPLDRSKPEMPKVGE